MRPPTTFLLHSLRRASGLRNTGCVRQLRASSSAPARSAAARPSNPDASQQPSRLPNLYNPRAPSSQDRGPASTESTTTDFDALNVLGEAAPPSNAVDACLPDGFVLDNGVSIEGGAGVLLVQGEAFRWQPWQVRGDNGGNTGAKPPSLLMDAMINAKGQFEVPQEAWGVLDCVWPKPELLILGLGGSIHPLAPATRKHISDLGIRVDVQDTRNAAGQFNLLATERGVENVAAALVPIGWWGKIRARAR